MSRRPKKEPQKQDLLQNWLNAELPKTSRFRQKRAIFNTMNSSDPLFINTINQFIENHRLIAPGQTIILGLSGGPDSLFLLHLLAPLHQSGTITVIAAHLDHQWRANSAQDV